MRALPRLAVLPVLFVAAGLLGCGDNKTIIEKSDDAPATTVVTIVKGGGPKTVTVPDGEPGPSGPTSGPNGLSYTGASAGFATNVRDEYMRRGGGTITVNAYSAAKGRSYDIDCVAGATVVCQGGTTENAHITFPGAGGGSNIGEDLHYTGASAGFAQNVKEAYLREGPGDITVTAYSPAKGRSYDIVCTDGATVVCQGGTTEHAYITFSGG